MELNQKLVNMADDYYGNIAVNDFSSFIISDFKNDVLIDLSPERADENVRRSVAFIDDVKAMMETPLGPDDLAIAKSLIDFAEYIKSSSENYWYKFNATHQTCPLKYVIKRLETFPMESESDKARYHRLFAQLPKVVNGMRQKLARQLEMGLGIYSEELDISKRMFASYIQGSNSLLNPENRGIGISPAMAGDISKIIVDLNTELDGLIRDLDGFGAKGFKSLGATKGGEAYYGSLIKTYTSYNLTPQEIHQIGLRELEVTNGKMRDLIRLMGYNMSQEEFNRTVLTDRRFFDDTTEQLGARFARCLEKIRPKLPTVFKHLPKADCISLPLSKDGEETTSWGYYSVPIGTEKRGVFYFSGKDLHIRNQIRTAAITYHELLPGHHMQVNLAKEDKTLPKISQNHFNTAFADGWAEYASDVANELSMYDEFDLYGRYIWDQILCVRLIVDTGVNAMGWDISRVRRFMAENTILSELEIKMESLRYSVDNPGQALAYKMGSLKNHELRKLAEGTLGARFDRKEYHDTVLKYGSIPLYLLHENVENFIKRF